MTLHRKNLPCLVRPGFLGVISLLLLPLVVGSCSTDGATVGARDGRLQAVSPVTAAKPPAPEGLVLRLDFSRIADGRIADSSPNGWEGHLDGGPKLVQESQGATLEFNGFDQAVSVPGSANLSITRGLTVAAVVRFSDQRPAPGCADMILWKPDCFLFGRDDAGRLYFNIHDGAKWAAALRSKDPLPLGKYLHVAVTVEYVDDSAQGFAGYRARLWVNGEAIASDSFNRLVFARNERPVDLCKGWGGPWHLTGRLASASLHDRALTDGEILADAAANPFVTGLGKTIAVAPEIQSRLEALRARVQTPEAAWIAATIGRLARDARFAAMSGPLLERAEAMAAEKPAGVLAWWRKDERGLRLVAGDRLHAALAVIDGRCELAGLYDVEAQRELLGTLGSWWTLEALSPDGRKCELSSADLPSSLEAGPVREAGVTRFTIAWTHQATADEPLACTIRSTLRLEGRRLSMDLAVENRSPEVVLSEVIFPSVSLKRLERGEDTLIAPYFYGEAHRDPVRRNISYSGRYPSAQATMQFAAYHDDRQGVYVAAEDPDAQTKQLTILGKNGQLAISWRWFVGNAGHGGNGFATSGRAVIEGFAGNWFDAGQIYKRWLAREARWFPALGRPDTPRWYKENTVVVLHYGQFLEAFGKYFGLPFIFHDEWWSQKGDGGNALGAWPHAEAQAGFKDIVADRLRYGCYSRPYMNHRLWTKNSPDYDTVGLPSAVKKRDGSLGSIEDYSVHGAAGGFSVVMCPAAPLNQEYRGKLLAHIADQGVGSLYMDQMGAGEPLLCFDPSHGHSLGGGENWMKEGYVKYFAIQRKALKEAHPQLAFDAEDMAEPLAGVLDGYLPWRSFAVHPGTTRLPVFASIYAGRIQFTGKSSSGNDREAFYAIAGEQLVNGEQFGYIWPNKILNSDQRRAYFKRLALTRLAILPFMNEGEMERPLELRQVPVFVADWGFFGPRRLESPAIMHSVWKRPEGLAVVFVNVTAAEVTTEVGFEGKRRGLPGDTLALRICGSDGDEIAPVANRFSRKLRLPAYSTVVWLVSPAAGASRPLADQIATGMVAAKAVPVPPAWMAPAPRGPVAARYVRIEALFHSVQMAECEVMSKGVNVALGKPATQSSNWQPFSDASRAVDGDTNPKMIRQANAGNSVSVTGSRAAEWWEVDLGGPVSVEAIRIHALNAEPLCEKRILALDEQRQVIWGAELYETKPLHDLRLNAR